MEDDHQQQKGFWQPHTSSIDFCEPNYAIVDSIVEIHNVWSSLLFISGLGVWGLYKGNPSQEWRFTISYTILILIGIGSACLHGTLHWIFQSSDEVPMLYIVICLGYSVFECETPRHTHNNYKTCGGSILLAIVITIVYYRFQSLYFMFLGTFTISTIVATIGLIKIVYKTQTKTNCPHVTRLFWMGELYFVGVGTSVWILDMLLCEQIVLPMTNNTMLGWFKGITPHVLWHLAAALGTYVLTSSLCCCRLAALHIPYHVSYHLGGMIPIIHTTNNNSSSETGISPKKNL